MSDYLNTTEVEVDATNVEEGKEFDLSAFDDAVVEVEDSTASFAAPREPLVKGVYWVEWEIAEDMRNNPNSMLRMTRETIVKGKRNPPRPYLYLSLVGRVLLPNPETGELEDSEHTVFHYCNTLIFNKSQKNTEVHYMLYRLGNPVSNRVHLAKSVGDSPSLRDICLDFFATTPRGKFPLDWRLSVKQEDGSYKDIHTRMEQFPRLPDGEDGVKVYQSFEVIDGETVYGKNYVPKDWYTIPV